MKNNIGTFLPVEITPISQDWVNRHYRVYLTREDASYATLNYFQRCLESGHITQEEFALGKIFNMIAFINNAQNKSET